MAGRISLLPSKSARVANAARSGLEQALLDDFAKTEGRLIEELISLQSDNLKANVVRGRILMLREISSLVHSIGEKNG